LRRADADLAATFEDVLGIDDEDTAPWIEWTGPRGSLHDSGQVQASLIAEGSIGAWDSRRFRANIIVSGEDGDENRLVGARVRIGGSTFDVTKQIGRCIMTTRAQPATEVSGEIARDLDVLKTINAERGTYLGIGMLVDRPGSLSIGD